MLKTLMALASIGMVATLGFGPVASAGDGETPTNGEVPKPDPIALKPAQGLVPEPLVLLGHGQYHSEHALVMDKANRTLTVWRQEGEKLSPVISVPADFGRNNGDKWNNGDQKTPEGIYFFQQMKEGAELNFDEYGVRAFTLDYPNFFDSLAHKSGSGIWLHAIPETKSLLRGSRGCIVVRNSVIKEISPYITLLRTPIVIQDAVKYLTANEALSMRQTWVGWLNAWRDSWQNKQLDTYIDYYGADFHGLKMNKAQWREYKSSLNQKYAFIKIGITEPIVLARKDELVIRFLQDYQSDKNVDFGEKTLYLRRTAEGSFKIISEDWSARKKDDVVATH